MITPFSFLVPPATGTPGLTLNDVVLPTLADLLGVDGMPIPDVTVGLPAGWVPYATVDVPTRIVCFFVSGTYAVYDGNWGQRNATVGETLTGETIWTGNSGVCAMVGSGYSQAYDAIIGYRLEGRILTPSTVPTSDAVNNADIAYVRKTASSTFRVQGYQYVEPP